MLQVWWQKLLKNAKDWDFNSFNSIILFLSFVSLSRCLSVFAINHNAPLVWAVSVTGASRYGAVFALTVQNSLVLRASRYKVDYVQVVSLSRCIYLRTTAGAGCFTCLPFPAL